MYSNLHEIQDMEQVEPMKKIRNVHCLCNLSSTGKDISKKKKVKKCLAIGLHLFEDLWNFSFLFRIIYMI